MEQREQFTTVIVPTVLTTCINILLTNKRTVEPMWLNVSLDEKKSIKICLAV